MGGKGKEVATVQKERKRIWWVYSKERENFGKKLVRRRRNRSSKTEHLSRGSWRVTETLKTLIAGPLSSSVKKMKLFQSTEGSLNSSDDELTGQCEATGYWLIDLQSLSLVLSAAYKCEGEKSALTNFTNAFDISSGLKDKPISVYNLY